MSVKFLMSQKPNIPKTLLPAIKGFTAEPLYMFSAIIFAPASPNPKARRVPVLIINLSNIVVSNIESSSSFSLTASYSITWLSSSILAASRGFSAIFLTLANIFSIGITT